MSTGQGQFPTLTRAQRKVLADLLLFRDSQGFAEISHRRLAETTGVPLATVFYSIDRLNQLQLVRTNAGTRKLPSRHELFGQGLELLVRVRTRAAKAGRS